MTATRHWSQRQQGAGDPQEKRPSRRGCGAGMWPRPPCSGRVPFHLGLFPCSWEVSLLDKEPLPGVGPAGSWAIRKAHLPPCSPKELSLRPEKTLSGPTPGN